MSRKQQESDFERLFRQPDKGISQVQGVGGILARLLRTIWFDNRITSSEMDRNLRQYVHGVREDIDKPSVKQFMNMSNLRREILKPHISWKFFIKAIKVMKANRVEFSVTLHYKHTEKTSKHSVLIDLGNVPDDSEEDVSY